MSLKDQLTTVTVGTGSSIHWGDDCGTLCGAAHRNGRLTAPRAIAADRPTCKRCLKALATRVADAVDAALAENLERTLKADLDAPGAEVADLHVRKVIGGSDLFRVLGSSLTSRVGHTITVLWLENVLTRVRHCIRPDTLESHYVAVDQAGNPQPRVERVELHLEHNITRERYVFEGLEGEPGEGVRTLAWLRHRDSGKLYSMSDWVVWADYSPVCKHGAKYRQPCEECGEVDPNADAYDAHMAATQEGELKAPQVHPSVPNTVEAWKAYAERVKASRDAAEVKVADLQVEVAELRSKLAGQTPASAEFRVGDRILVRQYGEELEARVTFVGVGGQTIHAKVIGGLEVVRARSEVRHA